MESRSAMVQCVCIRRARCARLTHKNLKYQPAIGRKSRPSIWSSACHFVNRLFFLPVQLAELWIRVPVSNVYLLLNYGDFIDGSMNNTATPFVQLLSTTDPAAAHADFVATRLSGNDTQTSSGHHSAKNIVPIFIGAGVAIAAALAGVLLLVLRRRKRAYRSLSEPAPQGDT